MRDILCSTIILPLPPTMQSRVISHRRVRKLYFSIFMPALWRVRYDRCSTATCTDRRRVHGMGYEYVLRLRCEGDNAGISEDGLGTPPVGFRLKRPM